MPKPPPKSARNSGGARAGAGRPLKANDAQKAGLDRARSMLRDKHEDIALELIAQLSAMKTITLGGDGGTMEVPDWGARQKAIELITARSGFVPDPADLPASLGNALLDALAR